MSNDASDFVDNDFQAARKTAYVAPLPKVSANPGTAGTRPPSREEIESMVSEKQVKLAELKRVQEELERERAGLEDLRRRQMEFHTGRQEMIQNLTRGVGLLEEAELNTRREADQMARCLAEFREAVVKVQAVNEQVWTQENLNVELTRALTVIENARMEWNSARLKLPILSGAPQTEQAPGPAANAAFWTTASLPQLCKIGLAFTWPLVVLGLAVFLTLLLRR